MLLGLGTPLWAERLIKSDHTSTQADILLPHHDGSRSRLRIRLTPLPNQHFSLLVTDLTERNPFATGVDYQEENSVEPARPRDHVLPAPTVEPHLAKALQFHEPMEVLLDQAPIEIALLDREMRYLAVSRRYRTAFQLEERELLGLSHYEILPDLPAHWREAHREALSGAVAGFEENRSADAAGNTRWFHWELRAWHLRPGEIGGILISSTDITDRKRAEEQFRDSEQRVRLAMQATGVGIWEWNLATGQIKGDEKLFEMYGLSPTKTGFIHFETWKEFVLPEDLAQQEEILGATIRRRGHSSRELRIRRVDNGECRHIQSVEIVRTNSLGQAEWVVGTNLDITARKQAEQALRGSQKQNEFLAGIIRSASQPVAIGFGDGKLGLVNTAFERLTGYTAEELRAVGWAGITPAEWLPMEWEKLAAQRRNGQPLRYEKEYLRKDGTRVPVELLVHMVPDSKGVPDYYYSFITDISERKRAEEALRTEKERSELAQRATGVGIFDWNLVEDHAYVSPEWLAVYGLPVTAGALNREEWLQLVHPDDREGVATRSLVNIQSGESFEDEFRVVWPDGSVRWVRTGGKALFDEQGRPNRLIGTVFDTTHFKRVESALRESERRYRNLFESMSEGFCLNEVIFDASGRPFDLRYLTINPTYERQTGLKASEIIGRTARELFPQAGQEVFDRLGNVAISGEAASYETWFAPYQRFFEVRAFKAGDRQVAVLSNDITLRKDAETALRKSEARLRLTLEAGAMGTFEVDLQTGSGVWNSMEFELLGLKPGEREAGPETFFDHVHPDDRLTVEAQWNEASRTGTFNAEFRIIRADGQERWLAGKGSFVHDNFETLSAPNAQKSVRFLGVNYDITDRKRTEQALRLQIAKTNRLIESNIIGVVFSDTQRITESNDAFLAMVGYTRAELEAGAIHWRKMTPVEHTLADDRALQELEERGVCTPFQKEYFRKDGSRVPILVSAAAIEPNLPNYVCFIQDMSRIKEVEHQLREADRRKDEFLATLAHELRNPLAPIRNGLQVMRLAENNRAAVDQARNMMERQLVQLVRLVDDLLDVSRISRGKIELRREPVPLSAVVNSAIETSRPLIEKMGHELSIELPKKTVLVDADLTRLAQVFLNILNNAAKYTERGGRIQLTTNFQDDQIVVSVKDNGIGIAADQLPRIFEMFSQVARGLERSQGGLGIGLSLVKRLVEMHGGAIEARSEGLGKGSEFIVYLPLAKSTHTQQTEEREERIGGLPSLRILVVDDNIDGADSLATMLQMKRIETRIAYDGEEAVTLAREFQPHVILLDIGLPKLDGYEACRRIRAQCGRRKVVIIAQTGWGQQQDRHRSQEAGFDYHLVKPLDATDLLKLLANIPKGQ